MLIKTQKISVLIVVFNFIFVSCQKCSAASKKNKHFSSEKLSCSEAVWKKLHDPPPVICPTYNHQNHGEKMDKGPGCRKATVLLPTGFASNNDILKNSYIKTNPQWPQFPQNNEVVYFNQPKIPLSYEVAPGNNGMYSINQNHLTPGSVSQSQNQVSSCAYLSYPQYCLPFNNSQVFARENQQSNFLSNPSVIRVKRNLSCNKKSCQETSSVKKSCSNPFCDCQNCKCTNCQCSGDTFKGSTCRNKRHLDDFGQSVNKFFSNLFPKQFKDFHHAVAHMSGPSIQPKIAKPPQKFSLLEQLENLHKKNNPQFYAQPKSAQKYSLVNDMFNAPKYFNPPQKNVKNLFQPTSRSVLNNNLPVYPNLVKKNEFPVSPVLERKYKKLRSELKPMLGQNTPTKFKTKQVVFFPERSNTRNEVDQKLLLKKLKMLNSNFINQNLEQQCTDFMKKCLVPTRLNPVKVKFTPRNGEFVNNNDEDPMRKKRTIILSSDELDLPPHYEIEVVSEEEPKDEILGNRNNNVYTQSYEQEEENSPEQYSYEITEDQNDFEQLEGYNEYSPEPVLQYPAPVLQYPAPVLQAPALNRKYPSILTKPIFKPAIPAWQKPDVIIGKNVIKKAVQEELNNYQKKMEREQRLKELKEKRNNPFGYGKSGVPQNPFLMFFNAPVDFLKHFHNLNKKSINPVMTTLPNLVYTAKKYFRNFGKDFKNNCMNLASNIIGDFDNVNPGIIESLVQPNLQKRYKREMIDQKSCKKEKNTVKDNTNICQNKIVIFENVSPVKDLKSSGFTKDLTASPLGNKELQTSEPTNVISKDYQNFQESASSKVRKKRYVIKVVDSDEVQSQVEEYLTQKLNFKPLFESRFATHKPVVQPPHTQKEEDYDYFLESSEEKPSKKKIQIKKVKPRVIIDNKGLAFMEYNGIKRPLLFSKKKTSNVLKTDKNLSAEKEGKIDMLIQRAKEQTDLVGNTQNSIVPQKVIKERISHLLNEIDYLVNSKLETYDVVCEDLIKIHQIKISVEEDWKRMLIENKIDDIDGKIEILEKFKDLQNIKNQAVKDIAETLEKNNSEFVRRILISILAKLQRLQSLITTVVEDFETRFQMKTPFNTKKEIKFVDYLSDLKFINEKTRNDLVKNIGKKRDEEVQINIDILNKLKKLLHFEKDPDKLDNSAKIIWEMMNACKMQKDTVKEMNKKLKRNYSVRKELKILFDLQNRFDEAGVELQDSLGGMRSGVKLDNDVVKKGEKPKRKEIKDILADIKKRQEEWLKKIKKN